MELEASILLTLCNPTHNLAAMKMLHRIHMFMEMQIIKLTNCVAMLVVAWQKKKENKTTPICAFKENQHG